MDTAVDACVVHVASDLVEGGVLQNDGGHCRIRQRDRMSTRTVKTSQDLSPATGSTRVIRRITWEARCGDEWEEGEIAIGLYVAVRVACSNCSLGAPEIVLVLVIHGRYQAVIDSHVDEGKSPSVLRD